MALPMVLPAVVLAVILVAAGCAGGQEAGASSSQPQAGASAWQTASAASGTPQPTSFPGAGDTGTPVSSPQTQPGSADTATDTATDAAADAVAGAMMVLLPAPGLMLRVPADATTAQTTVYEDGMRQTYYDSASAALTVDVEYYADGSVSASDVLASEQEALEKQGVEASTEEVGVEGADKAALLRWESSGPAPWSRESRPGAAAVAGAAVIVDGTQGYSYGVYVLADSASASSLEQAEAVLESIVVSPV
ncbi:hypothetical protein [Actinomyces wuliandei]|uniref:hypothetical protein n=1 Tax=Actinomyces wuliandei TaxID=2057743 RepID=UPI00111976E4|nr:hypothetical protein [Actinomyces wuliandei]